MIVKSMSRKVPSYGQLIGYIDRDEGQEEYRIRHNVWGRDPDLIRAEFERNGELLQRRKNGLYLYHEIISITRAQGLSPEDQKSRLRDIAETYIAARCPDNLVFGGLHQDKEHSYHYHLMISANRAGERGRLRLTKAQFRDVQIQLERHVLQTYPELEQNVAIDKRSERRLKKGEAELERRTGQRPQREEVLARVLAAYEASEDRQSLLDAFGREGLALYVRGKNLGVTDLENGKNHRLNTLDFETADRIAIRMESGDITPELDEPVTAQAKVDKRAKNAAEGEKEKAPDRDRSAQHEQQERAQAKTEEMPEARKKGQEREKDRIKDRITDPQPEVRKPEKTTASSKEKSVKEAPAQFDSEENLAMRDQVARGEKRPDPKQDIMSHESWRDQGTLRQKIGAFMSGTYHSLHSAFVTRQAKINEAGTQEENVRANTEQKSNDSPGPQQSEPSTKQQEWRQEIDKSRATGRDGSDREKE
tara:strand:- start:12184 stop:13614 length:1431 start_codon:yes stop_codon:yes gene_type:complete